MSLAKEFDTTKSELDTKIEELKKLKSESDTCFASLEVYRQPKTSVCEELLGQLHEFVSEATKETEMTEVQEEEYQRIMGALDEMIKNIESQKAEVVREVHGYKNTVSGLDMQNTDLAERMKKLEDQNKVLKEQSKEITQKLEKTKQVEESEWTRLQTRLEELEKEVVAKNQDVSKQKDLLKHAKDDYEEVKTKLEANQVESLTLAKQYTDTQTKLSTLEQKYKMLKEKYTESREGNMKKYEARIRAKEKELEAIMERKYKQTYCSENVEDSNPETQPTATTQLSDTEQPSNQDIPETPEVVSVENGAQNIDIVDVIQTKLVVIQQENEALKREIVDLSAEKKNLEEKLEELSEQLQTAIKKKKSQPDAPATTIPVLKEISTSAGRVGLNLSRVDGFLKSVDKDVRGLYKEFILWGTSKSVDVGRIDGMQKTLNEVLEAVDDFKSYVQTKGSV